MLSTPHEEQLGEALFCSTSIYDVLAHNGTFDPRESFMNEYLMQDP